MICWAVWLFGYQACHHQGTVVYQLAEQDRALCFVADSAGQHLYCWDQGIYFLHSDTKCGI